MAGRFPQDRHVADTRFSVGVTIEVAKVLARFGFPNIMSFYDGATEDAVRLQDALSAFLYGPAVPAKRADMPASEWIAIANSSLAAELALTPRQAVGGPVEFRLIGNPYAAAHAAEILAEVFTVPYVSDPHPTEDKRVRIYLVGHRAAPYKGGIK
ncbi:hypothetical protein [Catelliglobosispora koreensis]|uniref:hypothetical protein n=1 Tax=Catelliglobosispora koreensis TaxID=129052 RepID=UPI000374510B|nr:hypothetical protein [Catelliglobosispora koreensis]